METAIALFGLVAVLGLTLAGITAVADQLRCTDAAREAARLVARGESGAVRGAIRRIAPEHARWAVRWDGEGTTVTVFADAGMLPGLRLRGEAFAIPEPGVRPPQGAMSGR